MFDAALRARSSPVRVAATLAIGQVRALARADRLRQLLTDGDTAVAASAAFALGLARDSSSATLAALAEALKRPPTVGREAAWALGELGAPAGPAIQAALRAEHDPQVTIALLLAASRLRPVPAAAVVPHARARDLTVRRAAAYAIGRPRIPAGVRALLPLASAPDPLTRVYVARGLARSAAGDSLADTALSLLTRLVADSAPHVRISAASSLSGYGPRARVPLLVAVRDRDRNVRVAAAQSLGPVLGNRRRDWMDLWDVDTGFMFRRSLVASAVTAGVIPEVIDDANPSNWQRASDWRYRGAVADAIVGGGIERVRKFAVPLTRDQDGRVRTAAFTALAAFADSADAEASPWHRELLLKGLEDHDFFVRATALGALTGKAKAAEVPAALASYRRALADSANDARIAVVAFIASAWRNDSIRFSDSLRTVIGQLPVPDDPLVRGPAQALSLFAGWRTAGGTARPLEWYERVVRSIVLPSLGGTPPLVDLLTERGTITLELYGIDAPLTVNNFLSLARTGVFKETRFHRVVPGFVAQDGDPRGDGNGGPGYAIRDELNRRRYERGAVGMALSGPDTGGSQYFLTLAPQPHLDGHYTVFAHVAAGLEAMDALVQGDRILEVKVR